MKTNKEIIDDLQSYFLKQDPTLIARALAGKMIDLNRLIHIDSLEISEKINLLARLHANCAQLKKFIKNGDSGEFQLHNIESE